MDIKVQQCYKGPDYYTKFMVICQSGMLLNILLGPELMDFNDTPAESILSISMILAVI